jgi:IS5 family transposase
MVEPYYHECAHCSAQFPLPVMLRIFVMQRWFGYSTEEMMEALHTRLLLRRFAGLARADRIPGTNALLEFHGLLERRDLVQAAFAMTLGGTSSEACCPTIRL